MNAKQRQGNPLQKHRKQLVTAGVTLVLALPLRIQAGGVVTNCTETALRSALAGGGVATFACDGTITLSSPITNSLNVILDGSGHEVTISGRSAVQVFHVNPGVTLSLVNLTIADGFIQGSDGAYGYANPGGDARGAGIYNAGTLLVRGCSFLSNSVIGGTGGGGGGPSWPTPGMGEPGGAGGGGFGGAIFNAGTLFIQAGLFANNTASGGNGGRGGNTINDKTYYSGGSGGGGGNGAGGAIFDNGIATLVNCTIAGNAGGGGSGGEGGTAYDENPGWPGGPPGAAGGSGLGFGAITDEGTLNLTNCTVALNWGYISGGIRTSGAKILNTLLATNYGGNCAGMLTDLGHNLSSDGTCNFTNPGSLNSTDPKIGPLANNGGPTLTMALLPGSPAIDTGNTSLAPATDQRGFPRPAGLAADIGAFEYGSVMPTLAVNRSGATGLNLLGTGNSNQLCRLLSSTNLSSWVPVATNYFSGGGTVLFYDTCAPGTFRFYRLVMP